MVRKYLEQPRGAVVAALLGDREISRLGRALRQEMRQAQRRGYAVLLEETAALRDGLHIAVERMREQLAQLVVGNTGHDVSLFTRP